MKPILLACLIALSVNLSAQTPGKEMVEQDIKAKTAGPLPALNGHWELYSFGTKNKIYYRDKIPAHINEGYREKAALTKQPMSADDSIKLCRSMEATFKNVLNLSYSFSGRTYSADKNGKPEYGSVLFNDAKNRITLNVDYKNERTFIYKIDSVNENELVLIPISDYGQEMGRLSFRKKK